MNAIIDEAPLHPTETEIPDLGLVAVKSITANANVVLDLQTAVYMVDLSKTLIKYVEKENAYDDFVCECQDENEEEFYCFCALFRSII